MVANEPDTKPFSYYLFSTDTFLTITWRPKVHFSETEIDKLGILIRVGSLMNISGCYAIASTRRQNFVTPSVKYHSPEPFSLV